MKKSVNVRIPLVCAIGLILGIYAFYKFLFANVWLLIVPMVVCAALAVVFLICRTKYWICCVLAVVFLLLGFGETFAQYEIRGESEVTVQQGTLSGRITDIGKNGGDSNWLYLENCSFNGQSLSGRVKVYCFGASDYCAGDVISANGSLRQCYAFTIQMNTSDSVKYRVSYIFTDTDDFVSMDGELTLGEKVRKYVYNVTKEYMPQNADIAYALLTGDRSALADEKQTAFTEAGIIHLLAVSGLHVGFVISLVGFFIKKLKLPAFAELAILIVPICFYAYICDFSPSVVRAVVMAVCLYISKMLRGKYDLMSSLCWAVIFILITQPLYLFDVGFQLSAMSVFGIATLYLQLNRILSARRMPKPIRWFADTVSMSFSCVVSSFFINAYSFGTVALFGIIVNIVAIPLVFVAFALSISGMIPWVFHWLLYGSDFVLRAILDVATAVQNLDSIIYLKTLAIAIPLCAVLLFVLGGYVNMPKKIKAIFGGVCCILLVICVVVASVPTNCENEIAIFVGYDQSVLVATSTDGEAAVVGNFGDYTSEEAIEYISCKKVKSIRLFLTDANEAESEYVSAFFDLQTVAAVYIMDSGGSDVVESLTSQYGIPLYRMQYNQTVSGSVIVQSVYDGGLCGAVVKTGNIGAATVIGGEVKAKHFAEMRSDVNVYAISSAYEYYSDAGLVTVSRYCEPFDGNFGANKYGNFTISEKHGKIYFNFGS